MVLIQITTYLLIFGLFLWLGYEVLTSYLASVNELARFGVAKQTKDIIGQAWIRFLSALGRRAELSEREKTDLAVEKQIQQKLREAGLESTVEQGGFVLIKIVSYLIGPVIGGISYLYLIPYYATVTTILLTMVGLFFPKIWLKARAKTRDEDIQRELPLLVDLTNLGTSAGWDVTVALERSIDILSDKFPGHPLMREFKKARLLASTGYTWDESLARIAYTLPNDAVRRCTLALSQALKQGGDRTKQLDGIANDAQRIYYSELDKRLAGMPVKAVVVTMILMFSYLMIVLAPAAVQVKHAFTPRAIQGE